MTSKRLYWSIVVIIFVYTLTTIYSYLASSSSLIFWQSISAYNFWWFLQLDSNLIWLILLHPFIVFFLVMITDRVDNSYLTVTKKVVWIVPSISLLLLALGFVFYGFGGLQTNEMGYLYHQFPRLGENNPFLFIIGSILVLVLLESVFVDMFYVSKRVTTTWWLQFILYISFYVFFGYIVGLLIDQYLVSGRHFNPEMFFIMPNYSEPLHTYLIYFVVLKVMYGMVIYTSVQKGKLVLNK